MRTITTTDDERDVRDRTGVRRTFVQDSDGNWAERRGDSETARRLARERDEKRAELERVRREIAADEHYASEPKRAGTNIGSYYTNGVGQCRHQAALQQVLMQDLGIDSRLTRGAANTGAGVYRGEHLWLEATLSDGSQLLVDPTWGTVDPLRQTYQNDRRRIEVPVETIRDYGPSLARVPGNGTAVA